MCGNIDYVATHHNMQRFGSDLIRNLSEFLTTLSIFVITLCAHTGSPHAKKYYCRYTIHQVPSPHLTHIYCKQKNISN